MPRDNAFLYNGIGLAVFGIVINRVYWIRIIISAFKEQPVCGLCYLFFPGYFIFYLITRWGRINGLFMMCLLGYLVIGVGYGMVAMSPFMAIKDDDEFSHFHRRVPAAVANVDFEFDPWPPVIRQEHAPSKGIAL